MSRAGTDEEYAYYLEKAEFCMRTGVSPTEYDNMTLKELSAWIQVHNKIQKERSRNQNK